MSLEVGGHAGLPDSQEKAAQALEALVLKQLLQASGVFKGSDAAGASLRSDLFADALADAVANAGGLGLGAQIQQSLPPIAAQAHPLSGGGGGDPSRLVPGGRVTSGFGARIDPIHGHPSGHSGVDVAAPAGTPILAAADGVVRRSGMRGGYGISVEIDHGQGMTTLYGHASELLVREGEQVRKGEAIAKVGSTGRSTGAHLHFEVRLQGVPADPSQALKAYTSRDD
ncbi:MAG: M23 family metallopeptidase [Deltaproteobacteria bacterium]|nr:M23 family metallopeptidase [Deltaproteobacteria bacterium]